MSYTKGTLSSNEEIKEIAKLHWINYVVTAFLIFLALISVMVYFTESDVHGGAVVFFIAWALYDFLKLYTIEMIVTTKRVICRQGIISVKTEELKNAKIESVEIKQSILGRIIGYGTVYFSGTGTSKVRFKSVQDPWLVKSRAEDIIDGE